ncbi:MAG TPA: 50S ribosomal protein L11 methyltransferase [Caulobacteraceae bacterium]|nr:50S ribosomal protein L11 methyltransferase [Caulobacteraceae bacterium]
MTGQALQIIARGPRADAEAAARAVDADLALEAATYSILEEDEARDVWRIDAFPTTDEEADGFRRVLDGWPALSVAVEALADADWLAMALSGLPPVRAGRFFVFGQHDRGRAPPNAVNLRIEAGAAFGTGHHGTTVGCLIEFDRLRKARRFDRVLDVGTGTGVLAIAAARTGSRVVRGTDIDPASVRIAGENARINRAQARFFATSGLKHPAIAAAGPYDLVFANILARPLIGLAHPIALALAPGGRVILSGLLRHQERAVRAAYLAEDLRFERRLYRDAWVTLVMAHG